MDIIRSYSVVPLFTVVFYIVMPAQPTAREPEEEMEGDPEVPQTNGEVEEERERAEETMEESGEDRESDLEESEAEEEEEEEEESSGLFTSAQIVTFIVIVKHTKMSQITYTDI